MTPPIDRGAEIRCYMRDPDGYLIEVGQNTGLLEGKLAEKRPEDLPVGVTPALKQRRRRPTWERSGRLECLSGTQKVKSSSERNMPVATRDSSSARPDAGRFIRGECPLGVRLSADSRFDDLQKTRDLQAFPKRLMGLEPTTFCMASRRSSQLSYSRTSGEYSLARRPGSGFRNY